MSQYINDLIVENTIQAPAATTLVDGLMPAADKAKLDQVNSSELLNLSGTISNVQTQLNTKITEIDAIVDALIFG